MGKAEKGGYLAEALGLTTAVDMYYQLKNMKKRQARPDPILPCRGVGHEHRAVCS